MLRRCAAVFVELSNRHALNARRYATHLSTPVADRLNVRVAIYHSTPTYNAGALHTHTVSHSPRRPQNTFPRVIWRGDTLGLHAVPPMNPKLRVADGSKAALLTDGRSHGNTAYMVHTPSRTPSSAAICANIANKSPCGRSLARNRAMSVGLGLTGQPTALNGHVLSSHAGQRPSCASPPDAVGLVASVVFPPALSSRGSRF